MKKKVKALSAKRLIKDLINKFSILNGTTYTYQLKNTLNIL